MTPLYRIKNWDANFENNRTRTMKNMMWVPVPNKHDGDGYTELVDRKNGAEMLGAWLVILQVASKCPERGTLMRENGTPHTPKSIARLTRLNTDSITHALDLLVSEDIGWLEVVDSEGVAVGCVNPAPPCHPVDEEGKGIEGKGIEGNGREGNTICAEPYTDSTPEPSILTFGCTGKVREWNLTQIKLNEWKETFDTINVLAQCKVARQWLLDNPQKRKTAVGMTRFLGSWFSREIQKGKTYSAKSKGEYECKIK